ncbi:MAG TPA: bifunctional [glutamate--ammonia ligase]-adenylyl-L-tyrosine phosphorylase/[glutamate--ammonia-ligase] adenylyltransferase, partial [Kofleriaceae bacterium]|nr:bifunctional [glutamate--ammonia ligase]-adenylyl-L-tyrosine phosphorylase/[glutamate--ammonia-ligase] adenylyltransferase [Kofleriaceae bacterium]
MTTPVDLAAGAPDPADAERRAARLFEAAAQRGIDLTTLAGDSHAIARLACQRAPYLATLLTQDPDRLERVAYDPYLHREKPRDVLAAEVRAACTDRSLHAGLRRVRGDELVRLGARELELGTETEVGRELSRLAEACFDTAIVHVSRDLIARYGPPRFTDDAGVSRDATVCVIGMGKLGGEELNFASDVDVIYVYASDQGAAGELSLHEYFAKLSTQVTAALSEVTDDGVVFRVDLRLRPEGAKGAIASSLAQLERYYETFGRAWERQAWIKARPVAGDAALGREVMRALLPFVWPHHTSPSVIDDVRVLNQRIKRELVRGRDGFDVKNGDGGIREIEFFVQALQRIHAGHHPNLRVRGTLAALDGLLFAGLVTDDEHLALTRAYRWLRHVEHVLQLEGGLQTQTLPADREVLARRLDYATARDFDRELALHTTAVARLFATLGDDHAEHPEIEAILHGELDDAREADALARLGFTDTTAARAELARARRRPGSPLSPDATGRSARVGERLLSALASSADPDQALRSLGDLIANRGELWSIWRLLDEQPAIVRLLGSLLGASAYLGRTLVDTPELIDLLVSLGTTAPVRTTEQVEAELAARLATIDPSDVERQWSTVAEIKNGHVLRVGLADFAGILDPLAVDTELTAIAEACVRAALGIIRRQLDPDLGPAGALAILALGKLGGRELGYASDLDVIFVYTSDDDDALAAFTKLAQRLLGALRTRTERGRLYEVDTRLRPSGSQGLLVSSLAAWRRYHAERAQLWERQALIKLRPIAGDAALGAEIEADACTTVYAARDPAGVAEAIRTMRARIESELGGPNDLKTAPGGIIDIEFAAQYLQLVHGHTHPALRTTSTSLALRAAGAAGIAPLEVTR